MKAAQINAYGGSEVIEINLTAAKPSVSAGKILIEVHAAGVNPVDWKVRQGYLKQMAPLKFPATLGGDFSGLVSEVGEGVSDFKKGEEVYGQASVLGGGSGSFAEYVLTSAATVAHKPKRLSHVEAAALPLTGISALQVLTEHTHLSKGQRILIHGGAGGIGTMAIQIAKHLGAYVATTAAGDGLSYVKGLGADEVIDYKTQSFEELLRDFDAVFDTVGGETYEKSFKVLKRGGVIVSMLEQPRQDLMDKFGVTAIAQGTRVTSERLAKLSELVDQGVVSVHVDKVFPLEATGEALSYLETGRPKGKVVLEIEKPAG
jgi:NADPH:quinone reductase-like Zn-dependent oxidoreductase